MQESVRR
jgi:hypothetical protein